MLPLWRWPCILDLITHLVDRKPIEKSLYKYTLYIYIYKYVHIYIMRMSYKHLLYCDKSRIIEFRFTSSTKHSSASQTGVASTCIVQPCFLHSLCIHGYPPRSLSTRVLLRAKYRSLSNRMGYGAKIKDTDFIFILLFGWGGEFVMALSWFFFSVETN